MKPIALLLFLVCVACRQTNSNNQDQIQVAEQSEQVDHEVVQMDNPIFDSISTIGPKLSYDYDLILNEDNFKDTSPEINEFLGIPEDESPKKVAKLATETKLPYLILIQYSPSRQSQWYVLPEQKNGFDQALLIYDSQELDEGGSLSSSFQIDNGVTVIKSEIINMKNNPISEEHYQFTENGLVKQ